jgi:pentapeptide MXKDX repeat protein
MRKIILTGAALTLMCGAAFAQSSTGPAAQGDNMNKPGTTSGTMDKGSMNNGSMNKGSMNTTGMSADKNNPKKEMSKDGSPADGSKEMKK